METAERSCRETLFASVAALFLLVAGASCTESAAEAEPVVRDQAPPQTGVDAESPVLPEDAPVAILSVQRNENGLLMVRVLPREIFPTDRTGREESPLNLTPSTNNETIVQGWVQVADPGPEEMEWIRAAMQEDAGDKMTVRLQLVRYDRFTVSLSIDGENLEHAPIVGSFRSPATVQTVVETPDDEALAAEVTLHYSERRESSGGLRVTDQSTTMVIRSREDAERLTKQLTERAAESRDLRISAEQSASEEKQFTFTAEIPLTSTEN